MMNTGDLMDGRFRLRDQLGAGGMAVVWRAHDEVLGRDVAVKVLSPGLARDSLLLARIRDEARAVARLRHPNIVDVYDYGEAPGPHGPLPYVVMEVVEGRSLSQLLTGGPLPWRLAAVIGAQVAAALAAAHQQGVVHRDVKPGNVVVGGTRVKLVDFGISALSGDDDRTAGELLGTPAYLAPERLEHGVVRPATDVYALGLLLYRALAGRLPWNASTTTEMLVAHRHRTPDPLPEIADLPDEVAHLCRRCLHKDPDQRPAAVEIAAVLAAAAELNTAMLALPGDPSAEIRTSDPAPTRTVQLARAAATPRPAAGRGYWRALPRHRRALVGAGAAAALLASTGVAAATLPGRPSAPAVQAGMPPAAAKTSDQPIRCTVGYVVAGAADGRFTTEVRVANTGTAAIAAARLTFTLPGEQRLRSGAPGTWRQNGRTISARLGDLAAGRSHTATIRGSYQSTNALPNRFQLNGTTCRAALSVVGRTTETEPAQKVSSPRKRVETAAKPPGHAKKAKKPPKPKKVKKPKKAK